ncbi:MAG: DUF6232 family protein [Bacteroidia bacterium]
MAYESVIYSDGHEVKVTPEQLIVGNRHYKLNGVTRCQMYFISPNRIPSILVIIAGIFGIVTGSMKLMPVNVLLVGNIFFTSNKLCLVVGVLLGIIGVIWAAAKHVKYAVRITTAEGEKNTVISQQKDYIQQIVIAINSAFTRAHSRKLV